MQRSCGTILSSQRAFQQRLCLRWTCTAGETRFLPCWRCSNKINLHMQELYLGNIFASAATPGVPFSPAAGLSQGSQAFGIEEIAAAAASFLLQLREAEWAGHTDGLAEMSNPLWQQTSLYLSGVQRMKLLLSLAFCLQSRTKGRRRKEETDSRTLVIFNH